LVSTWLRLGVTPISGGQPSDAQPEGYAMMLGIPWYAVVAGCALVAGVVTLVLRKHEGQADGQAGAKAVKLGRLY
jgi:hypothetical protein